ncbi:G-protein coupled receptor Mth2-like isoform X2 [Anthonomus grandis grandis]|uniref:G-protein coupled receptor Mth2-like isoform X2 n=1 Tax=Anthonomus grandis grandis TaxID=2921223 RepID=UPI0021656A18|nr:G-protein coupled receptor Mth2-like isoform X2 [Anthonomus grandis grandis]
MSRSLFLAAVAIVFPIVCHCDRVSCHLDPNVTSYKASSSVENCGCHTDFCLRKCCKIAFTLAKKGVCLKSNQTAPVRVNLYDGQVYSDGFTVGLPSCESYYRLENDTDERYFVKANGQLWIPSEGNDFYERDQYCLDEDVIFVCAKALQGEQEKEPVLTKYVNAYAMGISMPFLVVTFIVYALLPDKNLYQYALMIYVLILFAAYLQLVITNLNEFESGTVGCTFLGYSTYFAFISSFFWLNIICLDIWFTFSRGSHHRGTTSQLKKLGLYSIYGLGAPVLLVVLVYLLQFHFLDTSSKHNPSIGTEKCFFRQDWGNLWYLYLEATILFVANLVLFSWTALSIRKVKKETSTVIKRKHSEPDEQLYHVFMRLALAMGINWSTEIISFFGNWFSKYQYENIWIVTDCLNGLYGVFLFFIFVFKMKTWTLLKKRYYRITGKQPTLGSTVSSRPTNNSTTDSSLINTERSRASRANNSRPEETPLRGHV